MFLFRKSSPNQLIYSDHLYKNVISKLPITNRIKYCESLIYRTTEDISNSKYWLQKRKLKKLLQAAKDELKNLDSAM